MTRIISICNCNVNRLMCSYSLLKTRFDIFLFLIIITIANVPESVQRDY